MGKDTAFESEIAIPLLFLVPRSGPLVTRTSFRVSYEIYSLRVNTSKLASFLMKVATDLRAVIEHAERIGVNLSP